MRSEWRGQRGEVRGERSEGKGQRGEVRGEWSEVRGERDNQTASVEWPEYSRGSEELTPNRLDTREAQCKAAICQFPSFPALSCRVVSCCVPHLFAPLFSLPSAHSLSVGSSNTSCPLTGQLHLGDLSGSSQYKQDRFPSATISTLILVKLDSFPRATTSTLILVKLDRFPSATTSTLILMKLTAVWHN
ncbi:hypothetical protein ACOMHN_025854 [Nucella lapillus]